MLKWLPFHPIVVLPPESLAVKKRKETRQAKLFRYLHKLLENTISILFKWKIKRSCTSPWYHLEYFLKVPELSGTMDAMQIQKVSCTTKTGGRKIIVRSWLRIYNKYSSVFEVTEKTMWKIYFSYYDT